MVRFVARTVQKALNSLGYSIVKNIDKTPNLNLYRELHPSERVNNKCFYNIGAGAFKHPAWTNIDHVSDWYEQRIKRGSDDLIQYDLLSLQPIPVADESAELVYSSHTIEHITDGAARNMFNESYRMLKKGGGIRLTTPNIDIEYRAYLNNDRHYFFWIDNYSKPGNYEKLMSKMPLNKASIHQIFLMHFASSVSELHVDGAANRISDDELERVFREMPYEDVLNHCIEGCPVEIQRKYPGNHLNWWNKDKLFRMLKSAGFDNVYLSAWGQSAFPVLRNTEYFDSTYPKISIYVEAVK